MNCKRLIIAVNSRDECDLLCEAARRAGFDSISVDAADPFNPADDTIPGLLVYEVEAPQTRDAPVSLSEGKPEGSRKILVRERRRENNDSGTYLVELRLPLQGFEVCEKLQEAIRLHRLFELRYASALEELHRARTILDSVSSGITIADAQQPDLPLVYVNRAFERISGYSSMETLGKNCRFLQGDEHEQPGMAAMRAAIREHDAAHVVLRNFRRDGTPFWNELHLSPIFDLAGELTYFAGIQHDITQQVEAGLRLDHLEQDVATARSKLQAVFDHMNEAVVVVDRHYKIIHINKAGQRLSGGAGQSSKNPYAPAAFDLLHPDGSLLPRERWPGARALCGDYVMNLPVILRRHDTGLKTFCEVSTAPIPNLKGEAEMIIVCYRDTTERTTLKQKESMLAAIVDSSEDAIIGQNLDGLITSWNRSAERMFGYTAEQMIGGSTARLIPPGLEEQDRALLTQVWRGGTVKQVEVSRQPRQGQTIEVSLSLSPIQDASGRVIGTSRILRDITSRRQIERRQHQIQRMEAVGKLTGGFAHDFNNLLAVIMGNLDLLDRMAQVDTPMRRRLRIAHAAAARGAHLTRRLLSFSNNDELQPSPVILHEAIVTILGRTPLNADPKVDVEVKPQVERITVWVDSSVLENALCELIGNARDAMPQGGTITIATETFRSEAVEGHTNHGEPLPGEYARLSISDTGFGMSRETLDRAFEPFFTTKMDHRGSGLGLAMVYGFAMNSGGAVQLASEPDQGTTVTICLPLVEAIAHPTSGKESTSEHDNQDTSILLVDDEPDLLEIAATYIEEMGYIPYQATGSSAALTIMREHPELNLMMTDIIMPGDLNGVELAKEIRRVKPGMKVVYCSGFTAGALKEKHIAVSEEPLLHKPYRRPEFVTFVQTAMRRASADKS